MRISQEASIEQRVLQIVRIAFAGGAAVLATSGFAREPLDELIRSATIGRTDAGSAGAVSGACLRFQQKYAKSAAFCKQYFGLNCLSVAQVPSLVLNPQAGAREST